jgi:hypothetical protein
VYDREYQDVESNTRGENDLSSRSEAMERGYRWVLRLGRWDAGTQDGRALRKTRRNVQTRSILSGAVGATTRVSGGKVYHFDSRHIGRYSMHMIATEAVLDSSRTRANACAGGGRIAL